jgi:flagellin-like protein
MNFQKVQRKNRKAISPVLATVILIAITLIAAIAIAGFVFGLFGSFTSTAQVSGSAVDMTAAHANAAAAAPTCQAGIPGAAVSYLALRNTGTASASVTTISYSFGGATYQQQAPAGCTVVAGQTEYVLETGLGGGATAVIGAQFVAAVGLTNGGSASISGTFE